MIRFPALLIFGVVGLLACSKPAPRMTSAILGDIHITDGFAYAPITQESGAAYLTLRNTGTAADTLSEISSTIAGMAGMHGSTTAGGGSMMLRLKDLAIPPGGEVTLKPGGAHLMLERLNRLPKPGDSLPLTLTFRHAGTITLELPVRAYNQ
jgi:copper(I)-binding protein